MIAPPLAFSAEAAEAIAHRRPLVALESTIITHGMPSPQNLETARAVEAEVRAAGATPATIAVMDGAIRIGLDPGRLDALAAARDVRKLSRADLAVALAEGWTGSTTVAATMICARLAGIEVFATGGIGGVHRGAEFELRRLRRPRRARPDPGHRRRLRRQGDPRPAEDPRSPRNQRRPGHRLSPGRAPRLLVARRGVPAPLRLDDPAAIARAHRMRARLGLPGGQLVANPIPPEAEIPAATMAPHIAAALAAAEAEGIAAKAVTPFLLARIAEATGGAALAANIALVRSNARLAARIAVELAALPT